MASRISDSHLCAHNSSFFCKKKKKLLQQRSLETATLYAAFYEKKSASPANESNPHLEMTELICDDLPDLVECILTVLNAAVHLFRRFAIIITAFGCAEVHVALETMTMSIGELG